MNDNSKEIQEHNKNIQKSKSLKQIENITRDKNIGSAGQPEPLRALSTFSARAFSQPPEHSESNTPINSEHMDTSADIYLQKGKRVASNDDLQGQTKIPRNDAGSKSTLDSDKNSKEPHYYASQTFLDTARQLLQDNSGQDARLSNPSYLNIMGMGDTTTSTESRSLRTIDRANDFPQYQHSYAKKEAEAKEIINNLQNLERDPLSNNIKALISKIKLDIYEKCDTLESCLDTDQYNTNHTEAWKTLQQLSELTEIKGKKFIDCLNSHKEYQDDYEVLKHLTDSEIGKFKKQQDLAKDSQKQRIENFISTIRQEFQNIKQDPIDIKFNLKSPIEKISEKYQKMIFNASEEINEFSTLITDSSNKIANHLESYQEYQDDYETHKYLTSTRIEELKTWQNHIKEEHKQKIENFITTIEQGFQAIKQDPIDTEVDTITPIDQVTEKYNKQLIKASNELSEFSTLVMDSSNEFIDELKLTQVKELPTDILKSEIRQLKPQASLFGDSTAQELHKFLPLLQMIDEYGDNHFDTRYNKQILEIHNNISQKYLNEKTPSENLGFPTTHNARNIIKKTLHKINFPHDIPTNTPKSKEKEKATLSPDTSKNKGKEKVVSEQQLEKDHKVYILDKLKNLQEGSRLSIMSTGAKGFYQLGYQAQIPTEAQRYDNVKTRIDTLRNKITNHHLGTPWPDDTITDLEHIQSELRKPRKGSQLVQKFQDQIDEFSNEFTKQRQQQK